LVAGALAAAYFVGPPAIRERLRALRGGAPTTPTTPTTPGGSTPGTTTAPPAPVVAPSVAPVAQAPSAAPVVHVQAVAPAPLAACPAGSAIVPGPKPVCIDLYEYPGAHESPRVQVNFVEAAQQCGARGARLCGEAEWERACRGAGGAAFPYGAAFAAGKCNTKGGGGKILPGGSLPACKSASGAFDMSGNAAEWVVVDATQTPALKGGSVQSAGAEASCAHTAATASFAGGPLVGFRCCHDLGK
jgi:hypothetical protein